MNMTQKRWLEIPILMAIIWICQALELSIVHLPYYLGSPQLISLIVAYISFSRGWASTVLLTAILAFLGSANIGYATGIFIAAHVWSALCTKTVVSALTLEGRPAFALLVAGYNFFLKCLTWAILRSFDASPTLSLFFAQFISQTVIIAIVAWLLFPFFQKWDDYFMHASDEDNLRQSTSLR